MLYTSIEQAAEKFHKRGVSKFTFNPLAYTSGANVIFTSSLEIPQDPYIIGFYGSAWDRENGSLGVKNKKLSLDDNEDKLVKEIVKMNNVYGNLMVSDGGCPSDSKPSQFIRAIKRESRRPGNKEIYVVRVHPATKDHVIDAEDLYSNGDAIVFTNYLEKWYGEYKDAFRDRDSRNCDWCDAGIISNGGKGSLDEIAGMMQKEKIIAPLIGTKGIADEAKRIKGKLYNGNTVIGIFEADYTKLIKKIIGQLHYNRLRDQNAEVSVVDIRTRYASMWEPNHEKIKNNSNYHYKTVLINAKGNVDRTAFGFGLDELLDKMKVKASKHEIEYMDISHIIKRRLKRSEIQEISEKADQLREEVKPFIIHLN